MSSDLSSRVFDRLRSLTGELPSKKAEEVIDKFKGKYASSFEPSPTGPEVLTFAGEDKVDTKLSDFDLVFVFPNPGHIEEYGDLCAKGIKKDEQSGDLSGDALAAAKTNLEQTLAELQEEAKKLNTEFLQELIKKQSIQHRTKGQDHKVIVRDSDSKQLKVSRRCRQCAKKLDVYDAMCTYCRSTEFSEQHLPVVKNVEDLDEESTSLLATDLIRSFFMDPREGMAVSVSDDITNLNEARRAIIDIFLSFFRAQDEEDYATYLFKSVDFDELFLCVKLPPNTARNHADAEHYPLFISSENMVKSWDDGGMNIRYDPDMMNSCPTCFKETATGRAANPALNGGTVGFEKNMEPLLATYAEEAGTGNSSILRKVDRIRLLYDRVTDIINVQDMIRLNLMKDMYPLHTKEYLMQLKEQWARVDFAWHSQQPLHLIHDYFGENITLYFLAVEVLLRYLLPMCLLAVIFTVVELSYEIKADWSISHKNVLRILGGKAGMPRLRIVWAGCVIVWVQVLHLRLRRIITTKMNIWGLDSESHSTVKLEQNPRFGKYAYMTVSDLNENEMELNVPWGERMRGRLLSQIGTVAFIIFTTACSMTILGFQARFIKNDNDRLATYMSYALTVEIKVLNALWGIVGQWLVDHEYLRARLAYDNAMAVKNFYVQLVTTFVSFYYIAFAMMPLGDKTYEEYGTYCRIVDLNPCPPEDEVKSLGPWSYLTSQMVECFGLYLVFAVFDLVSPVVALWWSRRKEKKVLKEIRETNWEYSIIELQGKMTEYDGDLQNDDYMQIFLPLGFVLFFGATFPLSAILCYIYTAIQLRIDAWKLVHAMRRPYPRTSGPGLWIWGSLIDVFLWIVLVTNAALIVFSMQPLEKRGIREKVIIFFSLMAVILGTNKLLSSCYPPVSDVVELARRRHRYQREAAQKMFKAGTGQDLIKLRARKDIQFKTSVGRLRKSGYDSAVDIRNGIDRLKVDSVWQGPMPIDVLYKAEEIERKCSVTK